MKVKNLYIGDIYGLVEKTELIGNKSHYITGYAFIRTTIVEKIDNNRVYDIINNSVCGINNPLSGDINMETIENLRKEEVLKLLGNYHKEEINRDKVIKMIKKYEKKNRNKK